MRSLALAVLLCACTTRDAAPPPARADAGVLTPPPPLPSTVDAAPVPSEWAVGVPECDDFVAKYVRCVDTKVPPSVRETTKAAVRQSVAGWRQMLNDGSPTTRQQVIDSCKLMLERTKDAEKQLGCEW